MSCFNKAENINDGKHLREYKSVSNFGKTGFNFNRLKKRSFELTLTDMCVQVISQSDKNKQSLTNCFQYKDQIMNRFASSNQFAVCATSGLKGINKIAIKATSPVSAGSIVKHVTPDLSDKKESLNSFSEVATPQKRKRISCATEESCDVPTNNVRDQVIEIVSVSSNQRNTRNKFSESSSELPVSTPSFHEVEDFSHGLSKRPSHRPSLLKNNLPADSFERVLANITARNPQMAFEEKIESWCCSTDLSDVEDVNNFDNIFKNHQDELRGKKISQTRRNNCLTNGPTSNSDLPKYDYKHFRNVILNTYSENHTDILAISTSGYRRKCATSTELDRRQSKKQNKASTSPPSSASLPTNGRTKNTHSAALHTYGQIFSLSSSDSQNNTKLSTVSQLKPTSQDQAISYHEQHWCEKDINFDKFSQKQGIIKMRFDYTKKFSLKEKTGEVFKTPLVPQRNTIGGPSESYFATDEKVSETLKELPTDSPQQQAPRYRQDEFCNYLGLTGMTNSNCSINGKVGNVTLSRRSLRVRRMQQQDFDCIKTTTKTLDENDIANRVTPKKYEDLPNTNENLEQINGIRDATDEFMPMKCNPCDIASPGPPIHCPPTVEKSNIPEIKIICQLEAKKKANNEVARVLMPRKITPVKNSMPNIAALLIERTPPLRRLRTRNTSNGASTCPRSSRSDITTPPPTLSTPILPASATPTKRAAKIFPKTPSTTKTRTVRRLTRQGYITTTSAQSESIPSDRDSATVFDKVMRSSSCNEQKINNNSDEINNHPTDNVYEKFQKFLEESRQLKPSIFIVQSIDNVKKSTEAEIKKNKSSTIIQQNQQLSQTNTKRMEDSMSGKHICLQKLIATEKHDDTKNNTNEAKQNGNWSNKNKKKIFRRKLATRSHGGTVGAITTNVHTRIRAFNNQYRILRNRKIIATKAIRSKTHVTADHMSPKSKPEILTQKQEVPLLDHISATSLPILPCSPKVAISSATTCLAEQQKNSVSLSVFPPQMFTGSIASNSKKSTTTMTTPTSTKSVAIATILQTKDNETQSDAYGIKCLTSASSPPSNPLKFENGPVRYAYYELDVLIVIQEFVVSFWKSSTMINVLNQAAAGTKQNSNYSGKWMLLGDVKRLSHDIEIDSRYSNRICVHNSMPIYVEMRTKQLRSSANRECNLLSLYINIYYFHDEEIAAKLHSIQLDTVASTPSSVLYTTITDSRYFVMSFSHEPNMGKTRSGLCKYSLTPHLDTLASIREFKSLRHEIRYLEFNDDDKLIGFGETQLTIWDHRSGDILMNYDFDKKLGRNLGTIYFPSFEIGQNNMLLLFQYFPSMNDEIVISDDTCYESDGPGLKVIACTISHNAPSHRILYNRKLPIAFNNLHSAMYTGDHLIITAENDEEVWITSSDPKLQTHIPAQNSQRFYARCKQQMIEITDTSLAVDSFSNHVLKIAAATTAPT